MNWPPIHSAHAWNANLRTETLALIQRLRFCLVPMPGREYRFVDVSVEEGRAPTGAVEFMVYLMEDRTVGEVLRALPRAAKACRLESIFRQELEYFFVNLARTLKYNASAFVIEPPTRADVRATLSGILKLDARTQAELDGLPHLPNRPEFVNDSAMLAMNEFTSEPATVLCEAESSTVKISAA